jgi:hypothetical protein
MGARAYRLEESVIRQLRRKRRRVLQRRRQRRFMAGAAICALALASAFALTGAAGGNLADAASVRARSLIDLIGERSPGARTEGRLTKTKVKHGLPTVRLAARPAAKMPLSLEQVLVAPPPMLIPVDVGLPAPLEAMTPLLPAAIVAPPAGGGLIAPPSGGGGTLPGQPGSRIPPQTPVVPPVPLPEPGTWMTMLLGFALVGWRFRRNRVVAPFASAAPGATWDEVRAQIIALMSRYDSAPNHEPPQPLTSEKGYEPYYGPSRRACAVLNALFGLASECRQPDWESELAAPDKRERAVELLSDESVDVEARSAIALLLLETLERAAIESCADAELVTRVRWQLRRDPRVQSRMRYWWSHMGGGTAVMHALS